MTRLHDAGPANVGLSGSDEPEYRQSFVGQIPFGFTLSEDGLGMVGDAGVTDMLRSTRSGRSG